MEKQSLIHTQNLDVPAAAQQAISLPEYTAEPQSGSLLDYWRTLCRRKLQLMLFGVVGLGIGIGVTLTQAPVYRATTSLEIQSAKDNDLASKILNPQQTETAPADSLTDIQTQIKLLQSHTLIESTLQRIGISSVADLNRRSTATAPWLRIFSRPASAGNSGNLVETVEKRLKVSAVNETRIVEVSYEAEDAALAARFANALTAEFIEQNLQAHWQMNHRTSEWLVSQLEELRGKLQQSEDALQNYAKAQGLIYDADRQTVSEEKLRELQSELSKAQAERVDKQSQVEVARGVAPGSVPEVLNDNSLRAMESTLVDLRKQAAEMSVMFKPEYTKAKMLHAQIESLESAIDGQRAMIVARLDNELHESERREQLLTAAYARQTQLVTDDSEKSIEYDMLKHDVDTNRQIYQVMLQRVKESSIAAALKATNVRVIDPAEAPRNPFKPALPLNAGAGLLAGLMLGIAGIVVRSKADSTVQEPGDTGMLLGVPELGVIPKAIGQSNWVSPLPTLFSRQTATKSLDLQVITSPNLSPQIADSFRAVLASILFAGARKKQRVLVVTSASPGEGKTTTTAHLAATLANMGRRVLLIDGDIRSPQIHSVFGLDNSAGLTTMLKHIGVSDVWNDVFIRESSVPNLHIITAGPAVQSGADLLFSTSMPALIARYRNEYDMVLIDTAPMLVMPDARVLGRVADAVVLLARAGETTRSAIQAAYRRFVEDGTPVLGVVLNGWDAKLSAHKYYAAYKEPVVKRVEVGATPVEAQ